MVAVRASRRARAHTRRLPRRRQGETPEHFARRLTSRQIMDLRAEDRRAKAIALDRLEGRSGDLSIEERALDRDRLYPRNKHGRELFDDPEVESLNRFYEANGPKGVGFPNGEEDVEEVRRITGNPNYGKPKREWV